MVVWVRLNQKVFMQMYMDFTQTTEHKDSQIQCGTTTLYGVLQTKQEFQFL